MHQYIKSLNKILGSKSFTWWLISLVLAQALEIELVSALVLEIVLVLVLELELPLGAREN